MKNSLFWLVCGCLWACGSGAEPEAASGPPATQGAEQAPKSSEPPDLAHHMNTSFWGALIVRDALIDGDLDRARKEAFTLSRLEFPSHPEAWRPWVKEMQDNAKEISVAGDAKAIGQALAMLGTACAKCHERTNSGPAAVELDKQGAANWKDEHLTDRMRQHAWAADELWLGLVTPSELSWRRGARALANTFLTAPGEPGGEVSEPTHDQLLEIRTLGERATHAGTTEARASVYGDLLSHCGECHQASVR